MKKLWRRLAIAVFVCTIFMLIGMQSYLSKHHSNNGKLEQSARISKNWNQFEAQLEEISMNEETNKGDDNFETYTTDEGEYEQEPDEEFGKYAEGNNATDLFEDDLTANDEDEDITTVGLREQDENRTPDWGIRDEDIEMTTTESADDKKEKNEVFDAKMEMENVNDEKIIRGQRQLNQNDEDVVEEIKNERQTDEDQKQEKRLEVEETVDSEDEQRSETGTNNNECPEYSPKLLGSLEVNASYVPTEEEALKFAGENLVDGCFEPTWCEPRQTVAIIIPYKNRMQHLLTLMYHLHPILKRQWIRYCIFVAEQFDNGSFNKARVMNAAFKEIVENHRLIFDCVIFHDVDMLLEDDRNLYQCGEMPKHLSPAIDKFNYTLNYGTRFGGATAIRVEHYKKVNGHSNKFWGWGGEDNDMEVRIAHSNLSITVTNKTYGRYKMIPHEHPWWFSPLYGVGSYLLSKSHWSTKGVDPSGLNDIQYSLRHTTSNKLWTKLTIDIRTILVEEARVHFNGNLMNDLVFTSPSFSTEDESTDPSKRNLQQPPVTICEYKKFTGKTVNKTLGVKEKLKYGRMYDNLDEAKKVCDEMKTYCGSIVEEHPGKHSLRASGYMHENYLRYRLGMVRQVEIIEDHHTLSVHVKICQGDSGYLNYFPEPVIMGGDAVQGPSPSYFVQFKLRIFHDSNVTLMYRADIVLAHKAVMQEKVDARIMEAAIWDTMGRISTTRATILNMSNPANVKKILPQGYSNLHTLINNGNGIITVKTPFNGLLRNPGCYVCRSTLMDESGTAILQWRWWFEIRAKTKEIEKEILDTQLKKAEEQSKEFTETVEKRRGMWLRYHEKMKQKNKGLKPLPVPEKIVNLVKNQMPKRVY